jgi:xanthine dehydrogenase YagS FAD-binding subunit
MQPFALSRADDPAKAITARAQHPGLAFIAGGTDLVARIKERAALPQRLVDINGLPDIAQIGALPEGGRIQPPPAMAATACNKGRVHESL